MSGTLFSASLSTDFQTTMHETALVRSLLDQVDRLLAEHGASELDEVRVEVGPLSGVEPLLLQSAFERLAPLTNARGARLAIDEVPLSARCLECRQEFDIEAFHFQCPCCGSTSINVTRGGDFRLVSISVKLPEQA